MRQDLRHFLQQRHWDAGGLTRQTLLNGTRWATSSNAPCLGLRTAMELSALLLLPLCFPGKRRAGHGSGFPCTQGQRDTLPHLPLPGQLHTSAESNSSWTLAGMGREGEAQVPPPHRWLPQAPRTTPPGSIELWSPKQPQRLPQSPFPITLPGRARLLRLQSWVRTELAGGTCLPPLPSSP